MRLWLHDIAIRHWRALFLGLRLQSQRVSLKSSLVLYIIHFLGLSAIVRLTHQPFWFLLAVVLLIQPIVIFLKLKRWYFFPESLAPFSIAYIVLFLRLLVAFTARTSGPLTVPEPWGGLLNLNLATTLSLLWALLAQAGPCMEALGPPSGIRVHSRATLLGYLLLGLALVWSMATCRMPTHRSG